MIPNVTIQVRQRGTLTLPAELREKYRLADGDPLSVVDLDGAILLTPRRNVRELLPDALPLFERFLSCPAVGVCGGPTKDDAAAKGHADAKDIPILAAAIASDASLRVTNNARHFRSTGEVRVLRPSALCRRSPCLDRDPRRIRVESRS
jgi:bifunctional DNA-binding transcriptional regulator/antitoxin component of YhaV-PrlF toxin-antitoxin module